MPLPQVKKHPGYGVVYPDGITGLKVLGTFTEAPKKIHNPDGSTSYISPPPVIHELYGGGFAYASGESVTERKHLEAITDINMRERALAWFDSNGEISEKATADVPPLDLEHKQRPEPVYVVSSDVQSPKDAITQELDNRMKQHDEFSDTLKSIAESVASLADVIKKQGEDISLLKAKNIPDSEHSYRRTHSQRMKAKWADPETKARLLEARKKKVDGQGTSEISEKV